MRDHLFISETDGALYDTRDPEWSKRPPLRPNYSRHHREVSTVADLKACLRAGDYAWPGCYSLAYLTADGGCLCPDCVRREFRQIVDAIRTNDFGGCWAIGAVVHSGETDEGATCDHCGREIWSESV